MRTARTLVALVLFVALGRVDATAQNDREAPVEILHGFTLVDGRGGAPIPEAALVIQGDRILATGALSDVLAEWEGRESVITVDLGGGFVVPGLIDSHVHLATVPNREREEAELYRLLYSGVTAVRDMAGDGRALASLARDARLGEISAPDIYYSALMAGPSFLGDPRPQASAQGETAGAVPWMQAIVPETDMVTAVARAKGTFAHGIKIYANLEWNEVTRISEEAHRQGIKVWAHSMVFPTRPLEVVRSGVDVISHACYIAWEGMAGVPMEYHRGDLPQYDHIAPDAAVFTQVFEEMKARGTILDATLSMNARFDRMREQNPENGPPVMCDTDFARGLVRHAHELGVPIVAGTDFSTPPAAPFPALHQELEELVAEGGLSPLEAISSATGVAARAIGIEETHGTLEANRAVNFVLLAADPTVDIANLRTVRAVWKNAARYDRTEYRPQRLAGSIRGQTASPEIDTSSPQAVLEAWVQLWRSYDLDAVPALFLNDEAVSYFSSEFQGLIEGFPAVMTHHEGFGFVSGGTQPSAELWVEEPKVMNFGETAVVGGIWLFGDVADRDAAQKGPMTMVLVRTEVGYRIAHMNFGNYADTSGN